MSDSEPYVLREEDFYEEDIPRINRKLRQLEELERLLDKRLTFVEEEIKRLWERQKK